MANYDSPGVYIKELDFSDYISSLARTSVAILGKARKGPTEAFLITNQKQLLDVFGEPIPGDYGIYSALEVLSETGNVYYQRLFREGEYSTGGTPGVSRLVWKAKTVGEDGDDLSVDVEVNSPQSAEYILDIEGADGGSFTLTFEGETTDPIIVSASLTAVATALETAILSQIGALSNITLDDVTVDLLTSGETFEIVFLGDFENTIVDFTLDSSLLEGALNPMLTLTQEALMPGSFGVVVKVDGSAVETFSNCLTAPSNSPYFVETVINSESDYVSVSYNAQGVSAIATASIPLSGGVLGATRATAGAVGYDKLTFESNHYDSTWENSYIQIGNPDKFGYFRVDVVRKGVIIESHLVSKDPEDDRFVETVFSNESQFNALFDTAISGSMNTGIFPITNGMDGTSGVDKYDVLGQHGECPGLLAFEDDERLFDVSVIITPGWTDQEVINQGISVAHNRGDCVFIADPPFGLNPMDVADFTNGTGKYSSRVAMNDSYGALYWPWLKIADVFERQDRWLPPSAFAAAAYCYNDRVGHVWEAPAGFRRGRLRRALAAEYSVTVGERDFLYGGTNVVNPIVSFRGEGITIWGQKTLQRRVSALNRVNVRRLTNYMKKAISISSRFVVFESNTPVTWSRWKGIVTPFLDSLLGAHAIYEYKVVMDHTTVTPFDIDNNRMPGKIYFKPVKSAEFVEILFILTPTGASFSQFE